MSITDITHVTGFDTQQYQQLVEQARNYNIPSEHVDAALLSAINTGKTFSEALTTVSFAQPDLTPPRNSADRQSLQQWAVLPAPGATVLAMMVKMAAQTRETNRQLEWAQTESIAKSMQEEANKMRSTAATQLGMGIVSSALTVAGGITQGAMASGDHATAEGIGQALGGSAKTFDSIGQYVGTMNQADLKDLEADQEKMRTLRDSLKSLDESMADLIHRTLASMDSIQQSKNQAMTKILA